MEKDSKNIKIRQGIFAALLAGSLVLLHTSAKKPVKFTNGEIKAGIQDFIETRKRFKPLYKEVVLSDGCLDIDRALDEGLVTITKNGSDKPLSTEEVWIAFYNNEELSINYDSDKWNWESASFKGSSSRLEWAAYPQILVLKNDKIKAARTAAELGLSLEIKSAIEDGIITVTAEGVDIPLSYDGIVSYCNYNKEYSYEEAVEKLVYHWDHEKYPDWNGVHLGGIPIIEQYDDAYLIIEMDPEIKEEKLTKRYEEIKNSESKKDNSSVVREWRKQAKQYNERLNVKRKQLCR